MTMMRTVRMWSVVAGVALMTLAVGVGALARQPAKVKDVISGPATWVPVTYHLDVSHNGADVANYIVYRSSDGSTRKEHTGGQLIEIKNVATGRFYRYENGTWYNHPLRRQPKNGQPFLTVARSEVVSVEATDPRVQGVAASGSGCSYIRPVKGDNVLTKIICPELNLLDVYTRMAREGSVTEKVVSRLSVGEPQTTFLPPPDVVVTERTDEGGPGYISKTPGGLALRDGMLTKEQP